MLGFYGIRLVNKETGEVKRAENWKERFGNLERWMLKCSVRSRNGILFLVVPLMQASNACPPHCRNMHNNLRITRILKSLGELGFKHYQAPLVRFFLEETLVKKTLSSVKRSVLDYFLFAVLDKEKRQELVRFAYHHFEPKDKFVWCPRKIQKQFRKTEKRSDVDGKEEAYSRGKSKEGEAGVQQKEDGLDKVPKDQKGVTKTAGKDKNASPESSPEPNQEDEAVGNGSAEAESEKFLENGSDCTEEMDEMDQSPSTDTVTAKSEPCADGDRKAASGTKDTVQEADLMQTDRDAEPEKPPKKKREDDAAVPVPSPGPAAGSATGPAVEEKASGSKASSSSGQTPLKTSKHSPSPCQGREEKIPRTDFNQVPDKREDLEMSQEGLSAANGSPRGSGKDESEQTNGKESDEMTMESHNSSSSQSMGDLWTNDMNHTKYFYWRLNEM